MKVTVAYKKIAKPDRPGRNGGIQHRTKDLVKKIYTEGLSPAVMNKLTTGSDRPLLANHAKKLVVKALGPNDGHKKVTVEGNDIFVYKEPGCLTPFSFKISAILYAAKAKAGSSTQYSTLKKAILNQIDSSPGPQSAAMKKEIDQLDSDPALNRTQLRLQTEFGKVLFDSEPAGKRINGLRRVFDDIRNCVQELENQLSKQPIETALLNVRDLRSYHTVSTNIKSNRKKALEETSQLYNDLLFLNSIETLYNAQSPVAKLCQDNGVDLSEVSKLKASLTKSFDKIRSEHHELKTRLDDLAHQTTMAPGIYYSACPDHPHLNHDGFYVNPEIGFYGVFDGVGGSKDPVAASRALAVACHHHSEDLMRELNDAAKAGSRRGRLVEIIRKKLTDSLLPEFHADLGSIEDSATTAAILLTLKDNQRFVLCFGDASAMFVGSDQFLNPFDYDKNQEKELADIDKPWKVWGVKDLQTLKTKHDANPPKEDLRNAGGNCLFKNAEGQSETQPYVLALSPEEKLPILLFSDGYPDCFHHTMLADSDRLAEVNTALLTLSMGIYSRLEPFADNDKEKEAVGNYLDRLSAQTGNRKVTDDYTMLVPDLVKEVGITPVRSDALTQVGESSV